MYSEEDLRWRLAQERLEGRPGYESEFRRYQMKFQAGYADWRVYHNKPRGSGKSTALKNLHLSDDIDSWLIYPNKRMAEWEWHLKLERDFYKRKISFLGRDYLHVLRGLHPFPKVILVDEPFTFDHRSEEIQEFSSFIHHVSFGTTLLYGLGTHR